MSADSEIMYVMATSKNTIMKEKLYRYIDSLFTQIFYVFSEIPDFKYPAQEWREQPRRFHHDNFQSFHEIHILSKPKTTFEAKQTL